MSRALLEIRNMTVSYPGRIAVRDASFSVPEGSITAFLGRNGAGKTSVLRSALGFIHMAGGEANVLGRRARFDDVALRRGVGYVPEHPRLPARSRVSEILRLASALNLEWHMDEEKKLLDRMKLDSSQRVGALSKGQLARLALILALAPRPKLLVLDEPTGGLDPVVRQAFIDEVLRLVTEEGRGALVSTHIVSEIEDAADRVVLLSRGKIVYEGSVQAALAEGAETLEDWFVKRTESEE